MQAGKQLGWGKQRGVSLSGLIVVLVVVGAVAVLAMKVVPTWIEFRAAKDAIVKAKDAGGTVADMRSKFEKFADVNNVTSVTSRDLVFSKDSGDTEISFSYEKRIPLADKVSLLIDYAATTDKSGQVAAQSASAQQQ
jgi:Tfp pilus assembly protein PilE